MIPVLPLRGVVVFPQLIINLDVGREKSIRSVTESLNKDNKIVLATQKNSADEDPILNGIHKVGVLAEVKQTVKMPNGSLRILVEGLHRVTIASFIDNGSFYASEYSAMPVATLDEKNTTALTNVVVEAFENWAKVSAKVPPELLLALKIVKTPLRVYDFIVGNTPIDPVVKQELLEYNILDKALNALLEYLIKEIEVAYLSKKISERVKSQIDKNQKEYYLREQLKAINKELTETDENLSEIRLEYKDKLQQPNLPDYVRAKVNKELQRLEKTPSTHPEHSVIRNYLDTVLNIPWQIESLDNDDIVKSEAILNKDHYGLDKVKERIIEYLSVKILTNTLKGPILCLVGPPGVGKTSLAMSVAKALDRKFVRMSLGGVRDEAEIRGHRRTYIGAMPGRIIQGLINAKTINPVFLLDEIDKMSSDFRGDPASAMLEVLDPEQNSTFQDHFVDMPMDLSKVFWLVTANDASKIPQPLYDRMEIIYLSSYTQDEKTAIASKYLLPKKIAEHGLSEKSLKLSNAVLSKIIIEYTKEAGVRSLERNIAKICRKVARKTAEDSNVKNSVTVNNLREYLGNPLFKKNSKIVNNIPGLVNGLAWTSFGGEVLNIEVVCSPGKGNLLLTGQLGDVMIESAKAAHSYLKANSKLFDLPEDFPDKLDIHVHLPAGAIPKDGPSAGVTLITALLSALKQKTVSQNIAMTGEISLMGRVLPVGGIKEKVLAAHRYGVQEIYLPKTNENDLDEVPEKIKKEINFICVDNVTSIINNVFGGTI